ncbi:hypothetical protein [Halobacterium yunchengense]|uniref:hypothetical protein n=1 Tax=Halobacterium yunchengense TaxID=3108497 RepID=UPI00300B5C08
MATDPDMNATARRRTDRTRPTYTDADCTGAPVVPDLSGDASERDSMAETVWSHRTTEPTDE